MANEIKLKKGTTQLLSLKGLSTAGYLWEIAAKNNKVVSIKKGIAPLPKKTSLMGASADEVFEITGKSVGRTTVIFRQKRSWEKEAAQEKEYTIEVYE